VGGPKLIGHPAMLEVYEPGSEPLGNEFSMGFRDFPGDDLEIGFTATSAEGTVPLEQVLSFIDPFTEGGLFGVEGYAKINGEECFSGSDGTFSTTVSDEGFVEGVAQFDCYTDRGTVLLDTISLTFGGPLALRCYRLDASDPTNASWEPDSESETGYCAILEF